VRTAPFDIYTKLFFMVLQSMNIQAVLWHLPGS